MYELEARIIVNRPIDEIFAFVADNENDPQWCVPVVYTDRIAGDKPGLGARYSFGADMGIRKAKGELEITEFEPPARMAWQGVNPFAHFEGYFTLKEVEGSTELTIHSNFKNKLLYRLLEGTMQKQISESYLQQFNNLKALLEK